MKTRRSKGQGSLKRRKGSRIFTAIYTMADGRRKEASTGTTDRRQAERILAKWTEEENQIRSGLVNHVQLRLTQGAQLDAGSAQQDYLRFSIRKGDSQAHVRQKGDHIKNWIAHSRAKTLQDLTQQSAESFLDQRHSCGISNRTWNIIRQAMASFMQWCLEEGHIAANPLAKVPKRNETQGRRRVRRALNDDELVKLLAVAQDKGRAAWYATAALAGLRKGEMRALDWSDVSLETGIISLRCTKAKKPQQVAISNELQPILAELHKRCGEPKTGKVWAHTVTDRTRVRDFARAGIAARDADGRVADLHCLRTTLGTRLARQGVPPQVAQKIMRHSDINLTITHYTDLRLDDCKSALSQLIPLAPVSAPLVEVQGQNPCPTKCPTTGRKPLERGVAGRANMRSRRPGTRFRAAGGCSSVGRASASQAKSSTQGDCDSGSSSAVSPGAPPSAPLSLDDLGLDAAWQSLPTEVRSLAMAFFQRMFAEFGAKISLPGDPSSSAGK
jgi:integrase